MCIRDREELEEEEEDTSFLAELDRPDAEATAQVAQAAPAAEAMAVDEYPERRMVIKNKILAVGRMSRVFSVLREEAERVSELKVATGTGKLPYGTLALGSEGIKDAIHNFDEARRVDIENERLPPTLINADEAGRPLPSDGAPPAPPVAAGALPLGAPIGAPRTGAASPLFEYRQPSSHHRSHSRTSSLGTTMSLSLIHI